MELSSDLPDELVKEINKHRLNNKNRWYAVVGTFNGVKYRLKAYNLHIQILDINNIRYGGGYHATVKSFKDDIHRSFTSAKAQLNK